MSDVPKGAPPKANPKAEDYLAKKLEETRKDCQWLLGLGAASVLGAILKDGFGSASPILRQVTAIVSIAQILLAMFGAMSWMSNVDAAEYETKLMQRLRMRYLIRNMSVGLLAISFILIAVLAWDILPATKSTP